MPNAVWKEEKKKLKNRGPNVTFNYSLQNFNQIQNKFHHRRPGIFIKLARMHGAHAFWWCLEIFFTVEFSCDAASYAMMWKRISVNWILNVFKQLNEIFHVHVLYKMEEMFVVRIGAHVKTAAHATWRWDSMREWDALVTAEWLQYNAAKLHICIWSSAPHSTNMQTFAVDSYFRMCTAGNQCNAIVFIWPNEHTLHTMNLILILWKDSVQGMLELIARFGSTQVCSKWIFLTLLVLAHDDTPHEFKCNFHPVHFGGNAFLLLFRWWNDFMFFFFGRCSFLLSIFHSFINFI